jgi:hypothetical protein
MANGPFHDDWYTVHDDWHTVHDDWQAALDCIHKMDKDAKVRINTVALPDHNDPETADPLKLLKQIAEETGGDYRCIRIDGRR